MKVASLSTHVIYSISCVIVALVLFDMPVNMKPVYITRLRPLVCYDNRCMPVVTACMMRSTLIPVNLEGNRTCLYVTLHCQDV